MSTKMGFWGWALATAAVVCFVRHSRRTPRSGAANCVND